MQKESKPLSESLGESRTPEVDAYDKAPTHTKISGDPFYAEANQVRLKKAVDQLNAGKASEHDLIEGNDWSDPAEYETT